MCDEFDTSCVAAANDTELTASYGVGMTTDPKGGVMKVKGSRRLVARLGLALAVAAIAAPGAQAMTMNAMFESGGSARLYADDVHQALPLATLKASNVRTDAASPDSAVPGSNVQTDGASFTPTPRPVSLPASNVRTDSASSQPVLYASNVQADAPTTVKTAPITDARHAALFERKPDSAPLQSASAASDPGIDWSVAAVGAILGALGLMLLVAVVLFSGRHNRRGRLAAT
jgi:hypothetical protein